MRGCLLEYIMFPIKQAFIKPPPGVVSPTGFLFITRRFGVGCKDRPVNGDIKGDFKGPCGVCRQVYAEFGLDIDLYLVKPDMTYQKVTIRDLLPMAFTPASLEEERI